MMVVAVGITSEEVRSLAGKAPATRAGRIPGLLKCLVVSGDADLRRRLDTMADLAGWSACEAPVDAAELRSLVDSDYHLVIADIARPLGERVNDTVEIAEEFAGRPDTLVVVCGSGESVDEELWARQLGAWVYLPGVSGGDALMSLFGEAQRVVERRGAFQFV
jgi:DNA-binding NtrC family response regulator